MFTRRLGEPRARPGFLPALRATLRCGAASAGALLARTVLAVLVLAVLVFAVLASPAQAHTELRGSDPKEGAVLTTPPHRLTLTFTGAVLVGRSTVRVAGRDLTPRRPPETSSVLVAELDAGDRAAVDGLVTVSWRAVSAEDGHAVSGEIHFRVRGGSRTPGSTTPAGPKPSQPQSPSPSPSPESEPTPESQSPPLPSSSEPSAPDHPAVTRVFTVVRILGFAGLALFVGGLAFLATLWPRGLWDRRIRALLVTGWASGAAATLAGIGLQGAYAEQLPLGAAFRPEPMGRVLATHVGEVWAAKGLLWLLAAVVLAWALRAGERAARSLPWRIAAAAVALGLLRTTGMTAHAGETDHEALSGVADLLHLSGVSMWFGGLVMLLAGVVRRRRPAELSQVVPRYATYAMVSVITIVLSGFVLTWQLVGSVSGLLHTSYGHLLLMKIGVFLLVLAAAQRSRGWVVARLDLAVLLRGDAVTVRPFLYTVAAETALVLAVLSVASLLVTAAPGR